MVARALRLDADKQFPGGTMKTQFSLFAAGLLACGALTMPVAAFGDDNNGGQNQDTRADGRGDRIKGSPPRAATEAVVTGNGINYHGGPVLHTINVYYIWYGNWAGLDPTGHNILTDFARNDGGSPYFAINTTYGDTLGDVPNVVTFSGETTVAGTNTALSDSDIANIVAAGLGQFGGIPDTNGVYFVLTAPGITETSGFLTQYCGWHTNGTFTNGTTNWDIKYAFVGNAAGPNLGNCAWQTANSPNGDPGADAMVSVVAHELEETATDPDLNAWYDGAGAENADKCAWTFGTTYNPGNGSLANMKLGARDFLIQQNWLNAQGGKCVLSYVAATPDFSLSVSPSSRTVTQGSQTTYSATVTPSGGFTGNVSLSLSGLPSGASASFNPTSISSGSSTMSVTTSASTPTGGYTLTVTGTSGSLTHSTTVTLVVNPVPTPDFSISASPSSRTVTQGSPTTYTATVTPSGGFTGNVSLTASGLPSGASATFSPASISSGTSTLTVTTSTSTPTGTYTLMITGTSGSLTHPTTVTLVVTGANPGFSISASPSSRTVVRPNPATYTVNVTALNGFTGTVTLSARGLPSGATASFNPTSVAGSGTSTMTVSTTSSTATGTFNVRIRGSSGGTTHSVTVQLVVQ
jgi:hypothetical protein